MKKKSRKLLVAAILASLTLATAAPAFAGPFADVPANHWSYDAVSKLAADGIIDGYGDGTFRGDRNMTRYEMAQIVGKAMEKSDKADAEQKALIDKLAQEFGDELESLGVRVSNLENRVGNIKWSGQVREWYEYRDEDGADKTNLSTRLLLFLDAPLTDDISFKGRIWAESGWGQSTHAGTGADASMDQAYLAGKNGNFSWTLGRQGIMLGKGLVYAWFPNNDGATLTFGNGKTKLMAAAFKNQLILTSQPTRDINVVAFDLAHQVSDDLDLTLTYAKNKESDFGADLIDTWAIGAGYKGIKNVAITAEYGQNKSDLANAYHWWHTGEFDDAKAWVAQAKYKGAEWAKPHSWGFWVGYRSAEPGFFGRNGDYIWETPGNIHASDTWNDVGYMMDNIEGMDIGVDYTVFNNGILTLQYFDLEDEATGTVNKEGFTAQLRYMF